MDPSSTPRMSSTVARSAKKGHRSVSSVSCGSLNHVETGTALFGWKMYDAGELSIMMHPSMSRPSCDRSWRKSASHHLITRHRQSALRGKRTLT